MPWWGWVLLAFIGIALGLIGLVFWFYRQMEKETNMKKLALILPLVAALGGCAGFTSEMLSQDVRIGVGVIRAVGCSIQASGGFGNAIVQVGSEAACRAAGGTVVAR